MTFENIGTFRILWSVAQDHPGCDVQFCKVSATCSFGTRRNTYSATQRYKPKNRNVRLYRCGSNPWPWRVTCNHPTKASDFVFPTTDGNNVCAINCGWTVPPTSEKRKKRRSSSTRARELCICCETSRTCELHVEWKI